MEDTCILNLDEIFALGEIKTVETGTYTAITSLTQEENEHIATNAVYSLLEDWEDLLDHPVMDYQEFLTKLSDYYTVESREYIRTNLFEKQITTNMKTFQVSNKKL